MPTTDNIDESTLKAEDTDKAEQPANSSDDLKEAEVGADDLEKPAEDGSEAEESIDGGSEAEKSQEDAGEADKPASGETSQQDASEVDKPASGEKPQQDAGEADKPQEDASEAEEPEEGKKRNLNIGMLIAGVIVIIVLAMIFMRGEELKDLAHTIQRGSPIFLVLGVFAQLGKYCSQGVGFTQCFRSVGAKIRFKTGLGLVFGTFFVNTVAPSFNLAGTSLVMDTAARKGIEVGKGTSAALFMQVCIDSGFVTIMLITFGVLSFTVGLQPGWFLLGLVAVALVGGLVTLMTIGGMKPHLVKKVLHPIERLVDRILKKFKKGPIDSFVDNTVDSFSGAAKHIVGHPTLALRAFLCSIVASTFEVLCFVLVGFGFGVFELEPLICGYVVATLFAMISFTPQGVGIVEAAVMVAFGLFHIESAAGLAIVMVYRSIVFWLPFLIGAIVIQRTGLRKRKGNSNDVDRVKNSLA